MPSWAHRYAAGEWHTVWAEIRSLETIADDRWPDVDAVAEATMRRARPHVDRLAEAYSQAGLVVNGTPIRTRVAETDRQHVARLEAEIGPLPSALRHCLTEIGGLWLAGDCPAFGLYYDLPEPEPATPVYPDPLVVPDVQWLADEWAEYCDDEEREGEEFCFSFAPDEYHKANVSGSTHDIALPQRIADPVLEGVWQLKRSITLVEYLRLSIAWAGCAGWSLAPERMPDPLRRLRVEPDF